MTTPPLAPDSETERLLDDARIMIRFHQGGGMRITVETLTGLCAKVRSLQAAYLYADECAKRCQANGERDAARVEGLEGQVRELQAERDTLRTKLLDVCREAAHDVDFYRKEIRTLSSHQPAKDSQ